MKERPIIMTGESVRAIIAGRKTQTRRIVKLPAGVEYDGHSPETFDVSASAQHQPTGSVRVRNPYGVPGDLLWVKETFALAPMADDPDPEYEDDWSPVYRADGDERPWLTSHDEDAEEIPPPWRPSIFMPRWASRITLRVTSVRVERVQAIGEADAIAEGIEMFDNVDVGIVRNTFGPKAAFAIVWDQINSKRASWASNPWVWVVAFEVVR